MINFDNNSVRGICHPARMYKDNFQSKLADAMLRVGEDQALEADDYIENGEYEKASEVVHSMIIRLEDLEESVASEHEAAHRIVYEEVDNTSYHGRVVRAADEYGENRCTLGALKAVKQDLESR